VITIVKSASAGRSTDRREARHQLVTGLLSGSPDGYGLVAASIEFSAIVSSSRPGVRRFHFLITKLKRK
jgi:hypothetical protein